MVDQSNVWMAWPMLPARARMFSKGTVAASFDAIGATRCSYGHDSCKNPAIGRGQRSAGLANKRLQTCKGTLAKHFLRQDEIAAGLQQVNDERVFKHAKLPLVRRDSCRTAAGLHDAVKALAANRVAFLREEHRFIPVAISDQRAQKARLVRWKRLPC